MSDSIDVGTYWSAADAYASEPIAEAPPLAPSGASSPASVSATPISPGKGTTAAQAVGPSVAPADLRKMIAEEIALWQARQQKSSPNSAPAPGTQGGMSLDTVSEQALKLAVDQAVARALETTEVQLSIHRVVEEKLNELDLEGLLLNKAEHLFESSKLTEKLNNKLVEGSEVANEKLEEMARDAVQKVFDGEGASNVVEKLFTKALDGRSPEDAAVQKASELFERLSNRLTKR